MSLRNILLLLFALVAAGGTALVARGWMMSERAALSAQHKPAPMPASQFVLVAKTNLPLGRFVKADDFRWQAWPEGALAPAYLVRGKRQPEELVGAVLRASLTAGEPVTEARLVKPGDRGFMAAVLQPGMRALSLPINATTGISGFVFPGDRVDLLVTHAIEAEGAGKRKSALATETVLSDLRVLAVDQIIDDQANKPLLAKTVTFEVTPKQAEIVRVAARLGSLSLTLRSLADEAAQEDPAILDADALVASLDQGDAGDETAARKALLKAPEEGRFTVDREVSRLLGGLGGGAQKVVVMRGAKSEQKSFRDGQPDAPAAANDANPDAPDAYAASVEPPEEMQP
ncbi:MAG: Flp pilus assembly protein CpaB [Alphaproteobacteria bacterium]